MDLLRADRGGVRMKFSIVTPNYNYRRILKKAAVRRNLVDGRVGEQMPVAGQGEREKACLDAGKMR